MNKIIIAVAAVATAASGGILGFFGVVRWVNNHQYRDRG